MTRNVTSLTINGLKPEKIYATMWNKKWKFYHPLENTSIEDVIEGNLYYAVIEKNHLYYFVKNENRFFILKRVNPESLDVELHNLYLKIGDYKKVLEYLSL